MSELNCINNPPATKPPLPALQKKKNVDTFQSSKETQMQNCWDFILVKKLETCFLFCSNPFIYLLQIIPDPSHNSCQRQQKKKL